MIFEDVKEPDIKSFLPYLGRKTRMSLAIDSLFSANYISFLSITGNYISEQWNYTEVLFGFEQVDGAQT
jgi:hypothetical protein